MSIYLFVIYCGIAIFSIFSRKSKIGFYLSFIMAWLLIAGNDGNYDYFQYELRYDAGIYRDVKLDFGFGLLCETFKRMGLSYQEFKAVISFACLLLIFRTIKNMSRLPSLGAAIFLIFPFLIDITQFRNFISYSIVFFAIPYLFEDGKRNLIMYTIIVVLAATIHSSSAFYLLFLFVKIETKFRYLFVIIGVVFITVAKEALKARFVMESGINKFENYEMTSFAGALLGSFIVIANYLLVLYLYNKKRYNLLAQTLWLKFNTQNTWVYCNLMFVLIIPFLFDNANYSRVYRNVAVLNMIFFSNAYYIKKNLKILVMTIYYAYFVYFSFLRNNSFQDVIVPVFSHNIFAI